MIDWINTFIFLAGSACLTVAISFGGVVFSWNSGANIALWTITGAFLLACIAGLKFHPLVSKENRLYPAHFLKQPIVVNMQLQVFLSSGIILVGLTPITMALEVLT